MVQKQIMHLLEKGLSVLFCVIEKPFLALTVNTNLNRPSEHSVQMFYDKPVGPISSDIL